MAGRENPQSEAYSETGNAMAGSFGKRFGGIALIWATQEGQLPLLQEEEARGPMRVGAL